MTVTVNGDVRELQDGVSVAELLQALALRPARVAIEINEEVVSREAYAERRLSAGDRIEIVHFVGGG